MSKGQRASKPQKSASTAANTYTKLAETTKQIDRSAAAFIILISSSALLVVAALALALSESDLAANLFTSGG